MHRSRSFGFSVEECRQLLSLDTDRDRASADLNAIALKRLGGGTSFSPLRPRCRTAVRRLSALPPSGAYLPDFRRIP
ncbi:MerR family DNA-binding protein [Cereibacter sphaeroides]|uniref:MerR family DNA-binding protein n=1 Tax=Cereibacter sphaeroides TaxID=1063 RepID=UPI003FCC360F